MLTPQLSRRKLSLRWAITPFNAGTVVAYICWKCEATITTVNPFECSRAGKHAIDWTASFSSYLQSLNLWYHARVENVQSRIAHDGLGGLWGTYSVPANVSPIYKRLELPCIFVTFCPSATLLIGRLSPDKRLSQNTRSRDNVWIASLAMVQQSFFLPSDLDRCVVLSLISKQRIGFALVAASNYEAFRLRVTCLRVHHPAKDAMFEIWLILRVLQHNFNHSANGERHRLLRISPVLHSPERLSPTHFHKEGFERATARERGLRLRKKHAFCLVPRWIIYIYIYIYLRTVLTCTWRAWYNVKINISIPTLFTSLFTHPFLLVEG